MILRTKLLQKLAESDPIDPNKPQELDTIQESKHTEVANPVEPAHTGGNLLAIWNTIKNAPNINLGTILPLFAKDIVKNQPFDWNIVIEEIIRRNDKAAAYALMHTVPGLNINIPDQMTTSITTEEEAIAYFQKEIESLNNSDAEQNFIKSFISKYKTIITKWNWLLTYYSDRNNYHGLIDTIVSFPDIKFASDHLICVLLKHNNLSVEDTIKYLKNILIDADELENISSDIEYILYNSNASVEDLIEIYQKQNSNECLFRNAFALFVRKQDAAFLNFYLQFPAKTNSWMLEAIISQGDENLSKVLIKKFLDVLGAQLQISSITRIIYYYISRDQSDSVFQFFSFLKGKDNRSEIVLKFLTESGDNDLVQKFLNDLDPTEMSIVCSKILNEEIDHNNVIKVFRNKKADRATILKAMMAASDYHLAIKLINDPELTKNDFDVVLIQKFIEQNGAPYAISQMLSSLPSRDKKINFSAGKRKYNELFKKQRIQTSEDEAEFVENLSKSGIAWSQETKSFIDEAVAKKDWFYANKETLDALFDIAIIPFFLKIKGKQGRDLYHEVKNDNYLVIKLKDLKSKTQEFSIEYRQIVTTEFGTTLVNQSTNIGQFVKLLDKSLSACKVKHDIGIDANLARTCILNLSIDIDDPSIKDFLEVYADLNRTNMEKLNTTLDAIVAENPSLINKENFNHNLQIFNILKDNFTTGKPISLKRGSPEYEAFKNLHTQTSLIEEYETIRTYINDAKPKNINLEKFNWAHPSGLNFSVLKYLDPYAFQVGSDTECCQRIGGAGAEAAIDSFINPLAGVLVLKYQGAIIAQSYFHFVPKDNGIILDNVEWNSRNAQSLGIGGDALSRVYFDFATAMKAEHPELSYVKCGTAYNKLDNDLFKEVNMKEDPREFEVEEPYSDFDPQSHLDLLSPHDNMKHIDISIKNKKANKIVSLISLAMSRTLFFRGR